MAKKNVENVAPGEKGESEGSSEYEVSSTAGKGGRLLEAANLRGEARTGSSGVTVSSSTSTRRDPASIPLILS